MSIEKTEREMDYGQELGSDQKNEITDTHSQNEFRLQNGCIQPHSLGEDLGHLDEAHAQPAAITTRPWRKETDGRMNGLMDECG